ncbi:MAG: hypothetical protein NTY22_05385 [Proteobacteria bacterium]|nr:hypothetical protein [Pseudomonadota bacterium]
MNRILLIISGLILTGAICAQDVPYKWITLRDLGNDMMCIPSYGSYRYYVLGRDGTYAEYILDGEDRCEQGCKVIVAVYDYPGSRYLHAWIPYNQDNCVTVGGNMYLTNPLTGNTELFKRCETSFEKQTRKSTPDPVIGHDHEHEDFHPFK